MASFCCYDWDRTEGKDCMCRANRLVQFENLIIQAFDAVPQEYYKVLTAPEGKTVKRERVFCYEFYHRVRSLQTAHGWTDFRIHGELSKRGSEAIDEDSSPDFVFHQPGSMRDNLIVVEVKAGLPNAQDLENDWRKLVVFCTEYCYGRGLWIVINYSYAQILDKVRSFAPKFQKKDVANLKLICKKKARSRLHVVRFVDMLTEIESGDYRPR